MNKFKKAYYAGYFDGDGCFYLGKVSVKNRINPKYIQSVTITSTNNNILESLQNKFKGTLQKGKLYIDRIHHKPVYYYSLSKKNGILFTNEIHKYLIEKKQQAECFIEFSKTKNKEPLIKEIKLLKEGNSVHEFMKKEFESQKMTINPNFEDFAYLAGFIDAECSMGIQRYRSKVRPNYLYKIILQCNNTKYQIFKWLLERFGGTIHFIDRKSKNITHNNQFTWRLCSKSFADILPKILPFLQYKKPLCIELMNFQRTIQPRYGRGRSTQITIAYKSILKTREKILHKIHILNKKGL